MTAGTSVCCVALTPCVRNFAGIAARFLGGLMAAAILSGAALAQIFPQTNPSPSTSPRSSAETTHSSVEPTPLANIADRAEELDQLLDRIHSQLENAQQLTPMQVQADSQEAEIVERSRQTRELLAGAATPLELEDEQRYWRSKGKEYSAQRKDLTKRAASLEEQIQLLDAQRAQWQLTADQIRGVPGIESIAERVRQQLDRMQATRREAQNYMNSVLILQNQISQEDQRATEMLFLVRQTLEEDRARILQPDSEPLWRASYTREPADAQPGIRRFFERSVNNAAEFVRTHGPATIGLAAVYVFVLLGLLVLRRYVLRLEPTSASLELTKWLKAPYGMAFLFGLLIASGYVASAPLSIAFIFYLLYISPVLYLLGPIAQPPWRTLVYAAATYYALQGLYLLTQLPPFLTRIVHGLLVGSAIVTLIWMSRPGRVRQALSQNGRAALFACCVYADLACLVLSLLANVFGFFSLAQLLGTAALTGPFVGIAMYSTAHVLILMITLALDRQRMIPLVQNEESSARWWAARLVTLAAAFLWLKSMLQLLTIYDPAVDAASHFLQRPISFQKASFTIGGMLNVILVMLGGYTLANVFIFLFKTVVLPRVPLQRGLPHAISSITYYVLLLAVALFALSATGVELNKFTVLTGAMGVGLGFGLQNIVNNFVSGIILLCERPIHLGDTVEVKGLVGTVRRIGARSSTVVTFQGAEVIIPNSNLLSDQVINWTLSSQWRRVDIKVGIAYGTDPDTVLKLLVSVAKSHPGVLVERPPVAFFMGFGESALNFELRFWCAHQDMWLQLQSDVTVAIARALRDAGIVTPFPQRELYVHTAATRASEDAIPNSEAGWHGLTGARQRQ